MKEHPILFSAPMVKAILDGRKTQTRRLVKSQPLPWATHIVQAPCDKLPGFGRPGVYLQASIDFYRACGLGCAPICQGGDHLWVKEAWRAGEDEDGPFIYYAADETRNHAPIELSAGFANGWLKDADECCFGRITKGKPSIFMPRWASRLTLEVTEVRVQRLQEISEEDAMAEGVEFLGDETWIGVEQQWDTARGAFMELWNYINGKTAPWASNPWVWAYSFVRVK